MLWDPSGLQLVTCGNLGHQILVHRAMCLGWFGFKSSDSLGVEGMRRCRYLRLEMKVFLWELQFG